MCLHGILSLLCLIRNLFGRPVCLLAQKAVHVKLGMHRSRVWPEADCCCVILSCSCMMTLWCHF